jgi:hypothetical protein
MRVYELVYLAHRYDHSTIIHALSLLIVPPVNSDFGDRGYLKIFSS